MTLGDPAAMFLGSPQPTLFESAIPWASEMILPVAPRDAWGGGLVANPPLFASRGLATQGKPGGRVYIYHVFSQIENGCRLGLLVSKGLYLALKSTGCPKHPQNAPKWPIINLAPKPQTKNGSYLSYAAQKPFLRAPPRKPLLLVYSTPQNCPNRHLDPCTSAH